MTPRAWSHSQPPGLSPSGSCFPTGLTFPRRAPNGEARLILSGDISAGNRAPRAAHVARLAHSLFVMVATLAEVIWRVITVLFSHFWDLSSRTTRSIPCNHYGELAPLLSRDADTVLPHSSLGRATVTSRQEATPNLITLVLPRHSLYGGDHTSPPLAPSCLEETQEEGHLTPSQHPITSLGVWTQLHLTHTHEEFASLATLQKDHT